MKIVFASIVFLLLIFAANSGPQYPEINDQFKESNHTELQTASKTTENRHTEVENTRTDSTKTRRNEINLETDAEIIDNDANYNTTDIQTAVQATEFKELTLDDVDISTAPQISFITKLYNFITLPFVTLLSSLKVRSVFKNIGTCIVNGAMEIISYYFPAPLIPLIASAAGLIIPFEPVVMLKEKMPVTSYRRAFKTAVDGFLGTFDDFKHEDEDPYMKRQFNRRFMGSKEINEDKVL